MSEAQNSQMAAAQDDPRDDDLSMLRDPPGKVVKAVDLVGLLDKTNSGKQDGAKDKELSHTDG